MFAGLRRGVAVALVVGASALGALVAGSAAAADPADAGGDFLTVASSPAGGFDNLAPGDTANWFVTARNSAAVDALLSLRVQSDSTSALFTDTVQGLRLELTDCSDEWAGTADDLRCPGTRTRIARGPLARVLGGYRLPALRGGSAAHYLAQVIVPREATNDVAGQAADLRFAITAVQLETGAVLVPAGDSTPAQSIPALDGRAADGGDPGGGPEPARRPEALVETGSGHASAARSLALALLAGGSLVLVLRRLRVD